MQINTIIGISKPYNVSTMKAVVVETDLEEETYSWLLIVFPFWK